MWSADEGTKESPRDCVGERVLARRKSLDSDTEVLREVLRTPSLGSLSPQKDVTAGRGPETHPKSPRSFCPSSVPPLPPRPLLPSAPRSQGNTLGLA